MVVPMMQTIKVMAFSVFCAACTANNGSSPDHAQPRQMTHTALDSADYEIHPEQGSFSARNRAHDFEVLFDEWGKGIQTGALYSTAAIEAEEGVSTATVAQVAR